MLLRRVHTQSVEKLDREGLEHPRHAARRVVLQCLAVGAILAGLFFLIKYLEPWMPDLQAWVKSLGFWGPLVYCLLFVILTSLFFPESIIAIAAGTLFGFWMGILWVVIAGTLGAILIFFMARYLFLKRVEHYLEKHPKLLAFDQAAGQEGFKLMFLLRLAPVNYTLLNYLLSVSSTRFRTYVLSCIGMFPGNISTVYIGFTARHVTEVASDPQSTDWVKETSIYTGLAFAILASAVIARIALRTVKKMQKAADSPETTPAHRAT